MKPYMLLILIIPVIGLIISLIVSKRDKEISKNFLKDTLVLSIPLVTKIVCDISGHPLEKTEYLVYFGTQLVLAVLAFTLDFLELKNKNKPTVTDEQTKLIKTLLDNLPNFVVYNFIKNMNRNEQIEFLKTVTIKEVTTDESREEEVLEDGSIKRYFSIKETPIIKTDADLEKWEPILREK